MSEVERAISPGYLEHARRVASRVEGADCTGSWRYEAALALRALADAVEYLHSQGDPGRPLVPSLRAFVPLAGFDPRWALFFGSRRGPLVFPIPTEAVVTRFGEEVIPRSARAWPTGHYLVEGDVLSYEGARERQGSAFQGTSGLEEVFLAEVWEDNGDDGHTDYELGGFVFVGGRDLSRMAERYGGTLDAPTVVVGQDITWPGDAEPRMQSDDSEYLRTRFKPGDRWEAELWGRRATGRVVSVVEATADDAAWGWRKGDPLVVLEVEDGPGKGCVLTRAAYDLNIRKT